MRAVSSTTQFLRDCWYAAEWSDDLKRDRAVARVIADVSLLLLRAADGTVHCLENRCPHRFAPLDRGTLLGNNTIRCGYHGLVFDFQGTCVHNPQGPAVKALRVKRFVTRNAYGVIWVWLGDPEQARVELIPNLDFLETFNPKSFLRGYTFVKAHYELLNDNIMDLSHVDVLHRDTLSQGSFSSIHPKSVADGEKIRVTWMMKRVTPSTLNSSYLGHAAFIDATTEIVWHAPSNMRLTMTMRPSGQTGGAALISEACHLITPESTETSHYLYCAARNFAPDDVAMTAARKALAGKAFDEEDKPMIEFVQKAMRGQTDLLAMRPALLAGDSGAVRVRRMLQTLREREAGVPVGDASSS